MNPLILVLLCFGVLIVTLYIFAGCTMFLYILIREIGNVTSFHEFSGLVGTAFVLSLPGFFWIPILLESQRTEKEMAAKLQTPL